MIPLDDLNKWLKKIDDESTLNVFTEHEKNQFKEIPESKRPDLLKELFEKPADMNMITPWYFWNKWVDVLLAMKKSAPVRLLELASGSNVGIPRALSIAFNHPETSYVTANTNKELTKGFREGTKDLI